MMGIAFFRYGCGCRGRFYKFRVRVWINNMIELAGVWCMVYGIYETEIYILKVLRNGMLVI